MKDAQTKSSKEECVSDMGQRSSKAAVKDAQTMFRRDEFAAMNNIE